MSEAEIPIRRLWKYREGLDKAIESPDWDEALRLAKLITSGIREALDPVACGAGKPTLDGLYSVGFMRYMNAPKKTKKALTKMNRILRTAKRNIPKAK